MKNVAKFTGILSIIAMTLVFTSLAFAAVPDELLCDAQPSVMSADGQSYTDVSVQLMARYADGTVEPAKMCGTEIKCESQNVDILHNGQHEGLLSTVSDKFGQGTVRFYSGGSDINNIGKTKIICRTLQQTSCSVDVDVVGPLPNALQVTSCPFGGEHYPDILADGDSTITLTAQVMDNQNPSHPIKKSNIDVTFKVLDTSIIRDCSDLDGKIVAPTNEAGLATATFCSTGSGSENVGDTDVRVSAVLDGTVQQETFNVESTSQTGFLASNNILLLNAVPSDILADGRYETDVCVQLRDKEGRIIPDDLEHLVTLRTENPSIIEPVNPSNPSRDQTMVSLGYYGVGTSTFVSSETTSTGVGTTEIIGSAALVANDATTSVTAHTIYTIPFDMDVTTTMEDVLCDGESTVNVTVQVLDEHGFPVREMGTNNVEGKYITVKSSDPSTLVAMDSDGGDTYTTHLDSDGRAVAEFKALDCKYGAHEGDYTFTAEIQSPRVTKTASVMVIKPKGWVPTAVNVYTDQTANGWDIDHPAHAVPALIAADGMKPVYVTAQLCEIDPKDLNGNQNVDNGNLNEENFCNPVQRDGVQIDFEVGNDDIIQYKGDNDGNAIFVSREGNTEVTLLTDTEGKATAIFRSSGLGLDHEGCSIINVSGHNGQLLDQAYAKVCATQDETTVPNAAWVWAQPAFLTADGVSSTTLRTALYNCDPVWIDSAKIKAQSLASDGLDKVYPSDLMDNCEPVQLQGAQVKFEVSNPSIIDDGMSGRKIITTTDQYGHASARFYSAGFDTPNIGKTSVDVFVDHIGEDITQLNTLYVTTEEKTWPWCKGQLSYGAAEADADHDQMISDSELLAYIIKWFNHQILDDQENYDSDVAALKLISAITAWKHM